MKQKKNRDKFPLFDQPDYESFKSPINDGQTNQNNSESQNQELNKQPSVSNFIMNEIEYMRQKKEKQMKEDKEKNDRKKEEKKNQLMI